MPPNGTIGWMPPCLLIQTLPASRRRAVARAASGSSDHTEAPRAASSPLAASIASSTSEYRMTGRAGPNCSSSTMAVPSSTSATMVTG